MPAGAAGSSGGERRLGHGLRGEIPSGQAHVRGKRQNGPDAPQGADRRASIGQRDSAGGI